MKRTVLLIFLAAALPGCDTMGAWTPQQQAMWMQGCQQFSQAHQTVPQVNPARFTPLPPAPEMPRHGVATVVGPNGTTYIHY